MAAGRTGTQPGDNLVQENTAAPGSPGGGGRGPRGTRPRLDPEEQVAVRG